VLRRGRVTPPRYGGNGFAVDRAQPDPPSHTMAPAHSWCVACRAALRLYAGSGRAPSTLAIGASRPPRESCRAERGAQTRRSRLPDEPMLREGGFHYERHNVLGAVLRQLGHDRLRTRPDAVVGASTPRWQGLRHRHSIGAAGRHSAATPSSSSLPRRCQAPPKR